LLVNPPSDPLREYTARARAAIAAAYAYAREFGHATVAPEHLLLGLLEAGDGLAIRALAALDVPLDTLRLRVEEILGGRESTSDPDVTMSTGGRRVIDLAWEEAAGQAQIGTEHLLLGIAGAGGSTAALLGIPPYRIHAQAQRLISGYAEDWPLSGAGSAGDELVELRQAVVRMHIREYHEMIAEVRRQKQAAIQTGDQQRTAQLRRAEQRLLELKTAHLTRWAHGPDVSALIQELDRLYHELERLHQLLRRHRIRPDEDSN
jgi:hypothetical protein